MSDRNFDDLAERFANKLYGHWRGQLRLQLVSNGLLADAECLRSGAPLHILDAGCGLGQISGLLAARGHQVTACDLSEELLHRAQAQLTESDPDSRARITFLHCPLQSIASIDPGPYDLIVCHAVLEWLDEPRNALQSLQQLLKPGGEMSLLFYNRHSLVYKNLLRGDFRRINANDYRGDAGGLTPTNPQLPEDVAQWLQELSLRVCSRRGIRTFFDYMEQSLDRNKPVKASLHEIFDKETLFSTRDPYRLLARYQMWHCVK